MDTTNGTAEAVAAGGMMTIIYLVVIVITIIGMWKLFAKAGHPGWACIVPFYNTCVLCDIGGKPMWWLLLFFIPVVNIVISIIVMIGIAKNFGRGVGTILGLIFFPTIFMLILGFGSAEYNKIEE